MSSPNNNYLGTSDSEDEGEFEDLTTLDRKLILTQDLDELHDLNLKNDQKLKVSHEDHVEEHEPEVDDINEKSLFGEESDEEEEEEEEEEEDGELPGLFGEDQHDSKEKAKGSVNKTTEPPVPLEEVNYTQIASLPLHSKVSLMERPSILYMDPRPFDPDIYEMVDPEQEEDHQLRMKVENTLRWRYVQGSNGQLEVQSNARLIEWSNGSRSLLVGDELLDWMVAPTPPYQSLVSIHHEDNLLITQTPLMEKIMIKPYGVSNKTHQKMASMLSKKYKRQQKTKVIDLDKNLEQERQQHILAEQEFLKAQRKLEAKKRTVRSKYGSMDYDEYDDEYDDADDHSKNEKADRSHRMHHSYEHNKKKKGKSRLDHSSEEDDLDDFIVEDDDEELNEPHRYNEEDELEELERAEQLLSARREAGNEFLDHSLSSKSKNMNLLKTVSTMDSTDQRSNLVTMGDDSDDDIEMLELDEEMSLRKGKKRAVVSDDEEEDDDVVSG